MKIRQFSAEDLPPILAIQRKCPQAARWTEGDYRRLVETAGGLILTAERESVTPARLIGFAALRHTLDQAELLNLAVDPEHQRQGAGRALVEEARRRLGEAGAKSVYLEVRLSNKPALALYYSVGFGLHSVRKDCYRDPPEDGYILCLRLSPPATASETRP